MNVKSWEGQIDHIEMQYELSSGPSEDRVSIPIANNDLFSFNDEMKVDKIDCLVAVTSGILTSLLDILWIGEFSLRYAQDIGTEQINSLVIAIAQKMGCTKNDLKACIRFLEKKYPMATDKLTNEFGGGLQHHLRDFSHHASPFGLMCSILNQFTGKGFGTDTQGNLITPDIPKTDTLGISFEDRMMLGVIDWFFHLISDMAGSSSSSGRGTGIPGPLLSFAKVLSTTPFFKELNVKYKDDIIGFSVWISKIFNGTAFEHTSNKDLIRFDLRTEMGIGNIALKQSIPVLINQCIVRSFYFVRRIAQEYSIKEISSISDLKRLEPKYFYPFNNRCITRMVTLATGTFTVIDSSDAAIRSKIKNPNNNAKFFIDTMLRINFIGVGAFVFSIKNEVEYAVQDTKVFLNRKTKAETLLNQIAREEDFIQSIEIGADMDNSGLYEYTFNCMYNHVEKSKNEMSQANEVMQSMLRPVLIMSDNNTERYNMIIKASKYSLIVETGKLFMRLFTLNSVNYIPVEGNEMRMPFIRLEEGKHIAYIFSWSIAERVHKWELLKEKYLLDGIKVVALVEIRGNTDTLIGIANNESALTGGFVTYETLEDLFGLLGDGEYSVYKKYALQFNTSIRELIGYSTVTIPSKEMMEAFKKNLFDTIKTIDYKKYVSELRYAQIEILDYNYNKRELNRIILGNSDFAESFLSAEWYYSMHATTSGLEQTAIVAGYLKSVEQLLYKIIRLSINTGKEIKKKSEQEYIEYTDVNESDADITLGSLVGFIKHYSELWDINKFTKYYIVNILSEYRVKYRNDHFHKDNVYEISEIQEIREQTLLLYYLLLGGCSISDEKVSEFDIYCDLAEVNKGLKYEELENWLNRILGGDTLLAHNIPIYCMFRYGEGTCQLQFNTVRGFRDEIFPEDMQYPYVCDPLNWPTLLEKEEIENNVKKFLEDYLEKGKYAGNFKRHDFIAVGSFGDPQIVYRNE